MAVMGSLAPFATPCNEQRGYLPSPEDIIDVAKDVIHSTPISCIWSHCPVQLNSWRTLQEHLYKHCQKQESSSSQQYPYQCLIPRCSARYHTGLHDIQSHIMLSHLSRVLMPCPVQECPCTFLKNASAVPDHISSVHGDLCSRKLLLALRPRWRPYPPTLNALKPLPASLVPAHIFATHPVLPARLQRGTTPAGSQAGRKRWKRMHTVQEAPREEEESSVPLGDLAPFDAQRLPELLYVWRKPPEPVLQQSRPQHMVVPPREEKEAPVSIGYAAFAARFGELERAGIVQGEEARPKEDKDGAHPQKHMHISTGGTRSAAGS
ncbi:hypothetical protein C8Q78DRAFT_1056792 [Trametes maxima]|nr:hypothetical protein C8Q78DRAFT_1056792 [Trametes maxima]